MPRKSHRNWLLSAEHIGGGCPAAIEELDKPEWQRYEVLTHTPPERAWCDALHRHGIRAMPYLNLGYEYASDYPPGQASPFAVIDQLNRPQLQTNYLRHDGKLIYESCHNTKEAHDLYLKRAEAIMKTGADGLFLDNAGPARKCWGPQFGRHEHLYAGDPKARAEGHRPFCYSKAQRRYRFEVPIADEEQTYATAMLIGELRKLVRSHRPDGCLMINGGDGSSMPPIFFDQVDAVMNEMFIYANYLDYNLPVPTHLDFQDHDIMDWLSTLEWEDEFRRRGVRMANLPSFSPHDPNRKRHSFFAFCVGKLWDAIYYTTSDPETGVWLREIRLGEPLGEKPGSWGAVLYREFEHGLVAANPYGIAQEARVPWTHKPNRVVIYQDAHDLTIRHESVEPDADGTIVVKLFPDKAALIVAE